MFSAGWKTGNFISAQCERLPTEMLVLLLQASRFPNSETDLLRKMFQELDVCGLFYKAMVHWFRVKDIGGDQFPLLHRATQKSDMMKILSMLTSHSKVTIKKSHLLCILFVSRTFQCLETFQFRKFKLDGTLRTKVFQCLRILHNAIQQRLGQVTGQQRLIQKKTSDGVSLLRSSSRNRRVRRVSDVLSQAKDSDGDDSINGKVVDGGKSQRTNRTHGRVRRVSDEQPPGGNAVVASEEGDVTSDNGIIALKAVDAGETKSRNTDSVALSRDKSNLPQGSDAQPQGKPSSNSNDEDVSIVGEGEKPPPNRNPPHTTTPQVHTAEMIGNATTPHWTPLGPYYDMSPAYTPIIPEIKTDGNEDGINPGDARQALVWLDPSMDEGEVGNGRDDGDEHWGQEGPSKKRQRRSKQD